MRFLVFIFLLLVSTPALADFAAGKQAYDQKDWRNAIINLRPLAESGDARAMIILGNMYAHGYGVDMDQNEAFVLYARAANLNHVDGLIAAGTMLVGGVGVKQSYVNGLIMLLKAAELGSQQGALFSGMLFLRGNDTAGDVIVIDLQKAYKWLSIAKNNKTLPAAQEEATVMINAILKTTRLTPEEIAAIDAEVAAWQPLKLP